VAGVRQDIPLELLRAAEALAVDGLTASTVTAFEERGIAAIVLKGPTIADWLYRDGAVRAYGDTDLLVSPADWSAAIALLQELGFEDDLGPLAHGRMESYTSFPWIRGADNVDLHCHLWGIEAEPADTWRVLSANTASMRIGGREVTVLAPPARALHVALHAAQHGRKSGKPARDLELALEQLPDETWGEAAAIAEELRANGTLATALRFTPEGESLLARLGLDERRSVDALLRQTPVPLAQGFEELASTKGLLGKLSLLRGELLPTAEFMRWWSPLARRGRLGLVAAYLWRPVWFALRAGPGLVAWRRARREASA
jgi:Uncharacterised nucleotidyltransferase